MSTGIKIYYNIVNGTMYDSNGALYGNSVLTAYFNNHLDLEVNYMTDTSSDSMQDWVPWTGLADKAVSSVVSFDRDYAHAVKGKTTTTTTGATSINVSVNVPEVELNYSDVLIAYRPDGSTITLPYNGFIYGSSSVEFLLEGTAPEDIPSGLNVRVPRSLYLKMQGDDIDNSLAAEGIFTFHTYLMSKKLLESLDYSDSAYLSGTMEHKIVFDGDVVRTFSFPFNITNLLDYNGEADVPETGNWASKEYVDSRIAASGGGGGGGGSNTPVDLSVLPSTVSFQHDEITPPLNIGTISVGAFDENSGMIKSYIRHRMPVTYNQSGFIVSQYGTQEQYITMESSYNFGEPTQGLFFRMGQREFSEDNQQYVDYDVFHLGTFSSQAYFTINDLNGIPMIYMEQYGPDMRFSLGDFAWGGFHVTISFDTFFVGNDPQNSLIDIYTDGQTSYAKIFGRQIAFKDQLDTAGYAMTNRSSVLKLGAPDYSLITDIYESDSTQFIKNTEYVSYIHNGFVFVEVETLSDSWTEQQDVVVEVDGHQIMRFHKLSSGSKYSFHFPVMMGNTWIVYADNNEIAQRIKIKFVPEYDV